MAGRNIRIIGACLAVAVVLVASVALACTNLATLLPSTDAARPGERVMIVGTSFPVSRTAERATTPVEIHWKTVDGPLLGQAVPDRTGTISLTIEVPQTDSGHATIVATQRRAIPPPEGAEDAPVTYINEVGTPARASIRILAPGEPRTGATLNRAPAAAADSGSNTSLLVLSGVLGAVALSLFGGGFLAFLHHHRTIGVTPQRWPPY